MVLKLHPWKQLRPANLKPEVTPLEKVDARNVNREGAQNQLSAVHLPDCHEPAYSNRCSQAAASAPVSSASRIAKAAT